MAESHNGVSKDAAIEWLESNYGGWGKEYHDEALHQNRNYFSDHFESMGDMKDDFARYIMCIDGHECDECGYYRGYVDADEKIRCEQCDEVQPELPEYQAPHERYD